MIFITVILLNHNSSHMIKYYSLVKLVNGKTLLSFTDVYEYYFTQSNVMYMTDAQVLNNLPVIICTCKSIL